jgi:hypothetical protein
MKADQKSFVRSFSILHIFVDPEEEQRQEMLLLDQNLAGAFRIVPEPKLKRRNRANGISASRENANGPRHVPSSFVDHDCARNEISSLSFPKH